MDSKISNFSYQIEEPSEKDIFISKGHENTANAIIDTIQRHDDIHIIGLEGALGAGKSTVINIVRSEIADEGYHFVCFDVDQHHHGSTKASFIKVFHNDLMSSDIGVDTEAINEAKDRALGNKFTYTKDVNSELTYYVLFFLLSLAFSVKYLPDAIIILLHTATTLLNKSYDPEIKATVIFFLGFSPLFVLLPVAMQSWYKKNKTPAPKLISKLMSGVPTFGNLLKKNSKDTINEIIDVNREVTSYELREAFKVFIDSIPDGKKIILVIDNLDRLSDEKTKEVWSDLDIFTSSCNSKCKIILPFSEYHVAKALKDDGDINTGYEYISKRLPVVFRAPPIVTSGWREQFKEMYWNTTLPNASGVEVCSRLIDIWESGERQITPRFLKKHVNDIACIIASSPIGELSAVCCSAYLLSVKYSHIKIEELLSLEYPDLDDKAPEKDKNKIRKLILTHKLLKKDQDVRVWSTMLACIHFQTTEDIAGSELLTEPSTTAMLNCDANRIIELSSLYGFNDKFSSVIEEVGFMESTKSLAAVLELDDGVHVEFVEKWLGEVSHLSKLAIFIPEFDQRYIDSLIVLNKHGFKGKLDLKPLQREIRSLSSSVKDKPSLDMLGKLYQYCRVQSIKPEFIRKPTADFFVEFLWPARNRFEIWGIEEVSLSDKVFRQQLTEIACQEFEAIGKDSEHIKSLFKWISRRNKISSESEHKALISKIEFSNSGYPKIGPWVYSIPFDMRWGERSLVSYLLGVLSRSGNADGYDEEDFSAFCAAVFASAIVSNCLYEVITFSNVSGQNQNIRPMDMIKGFLDKSTSYKTYLTDYLTFSSLKALVEKLERDDLVDYLGDSVRDIITNNRYSSVHVRYCVGEGYQILNSILTDEELYDFTSNLSSFDIKDLKVEDLSDEFVKHVIEKNNIGWIERIKGYFDSGELTVEFWNSKINRMSPSMKTILAWMNSASFCIFKCASLSEVLKNVFSQKNDAFLNGFNQSSQIGLLMGVLPPRSFESVARSYRERLLADTASLSERNAIIRNFGSFISMEKASTDDGKLRYIALVDDARESVVVDWLNGQDWGLDEWSHKFLNDLLEVLKVKSESFDVGPLIEKVEVTLQS